MKQRIGVLVFFFLCSSLISLAQAPTAVVNGQVRDTSGSAIPNASVEVINDGTSLRYVTETNDEGIYSVPNVPPGTYHIRVTKQGFKTIVHPDITLNVQDAKAIGFTLPVGPMSDTVTVEGGAPLVNTENAAVSTVVDQTYVKNMPLNGRSFQDLILLTPGTLTQTPQQADRVAALGETGEFSVNGQRTESNYYTVDGVSANVGAPLGNFATVGGGVSGSLPASTALGTTQALVSVDALQEFRVQSSSYSAEYGRNPGGQFAFETKSGTNQWHGTAYDYLRNDLFDANDWFNGYFARPKTALRQNDFGGTLGGSVRIPGVYNGKDKTFFFVSYEGLRLVAPQPATINIVPDLCLRGVVASCSGTESPAPAPLQPVLNAFPVPNGLIFGDGLAQYIAGWSNPSSLDSTSVRFDHALSDKEKLFFRFSNALSSSKARETSIFGGTPATQDILANTLRTYTGGLSSLMTNWFSNDLRINYSSNDASTRSVIGAFGGNTPVDLGQITGLSGGAPSVFLCYGEGCFALQQQQQPSLQRQWNVVDIARLALGRHQLSFGVDFRRLAPFTVPSNPQLAYFYTSESQVETNSTLFTNLTAFNPAHPLYINFSSFAQDEWKTSRRLNVSFGLRWDVNPAPSVTQGLRPYTLQPNTLTLAPQGTPLWHTTWYNVGPRLGVSYLLHDVPGRETVVRGAFGVFFDTGQQLGSIGFGNAVGFSATAPGPSSFPGSPAGSLPTIANPPVPPFGSGVRAFYPRLQLPYTLQWNGSIEQALGKAQALTLSYVGAHGSRLLQRNQFQAPSNSNGITTYFFVQNGTTSDYDSLQAQFQRRLSLGLTALTSYTWSHCLDYGSSNINFGYQRGNCDFDVRHSFSAAFSYDLPGVGQNAFLKAVLGHWGFDDRFTARTAFPVTLGGRTLLQPDGQRYFAGLNLVPGQPIYLYGANCASVLQGLNDLKPGQGCPGERAINPNAFTNVSSGSGNAARNFARGFGAWQMNLAVRRDFPIYEELRLQFRAEAFNIFNHPVFGRINPFFGQKTFGQATSTLAGSPGAVLNSLYQQGGPRSMQFALKLVF